MPGKGGKMADHGHHWIESAEGVECRQCGKTTGELREGRGSHLGFPPCEAEQDCDCEICELAIELGDERMAHARTLAELAVARERSGGDEPR
jgi:ribosomal protein L37E